MTKKAGGENFVRGRKPQAGANGFSRAAFTPPWAWRVRRSIAKPGAKPTVKPATIHEDLRGRDFTINSIALSLNPASRGLLLDPNNGVGDLERKELRAVSNYTLYDDPVRLLRVLRFKVRLGFTIEERTKMQYDNAREAQLETRIPRRRLLDELRHIADEPNCADIVKLLEEEKLLHLLSPGAGRREAEYAGLQKLQKARQMVPFGIDMHLDNMGLFLYFLAEKLAGERTLGRWSKESDSPSAKMDQWQKLEAKAKKLEKDLKSAKLQKPSQVYLLLCEVSRRSDPVPAGALFRTHGARSHQELSCRSTCRPHRKSPSATFLATGA